MHVSFIVVGILSLLSGIGLIYWINRRRFYRRNVAGLEGFSSFEASLFIRFVERLGKWLAYILILISLFCFYIYSTEKTRIEEKQKRLEVENSTSITEGN